MNIYVILFKSLYVRISEINKNAPKIATIIFFSILLTFNVDCLLFYFFNSLKLLENKNYNSVLYTFILVLNYFLFIRNKKNNNIGKNDDRKKLKIIGHVYTILSFILFFVLIFCFVIFLSARIICFVIFRCIHYH